MVHRTKGPLLKLVAFFLLRAATTSVPDPNPDPDPDVFGPPGSGYFYHQAKIVRKTLIPTVLRLLLNFLS